MLQLKSPYNDGTTHVVMSPLEFMQRLAALVPRPRLHLIPFHGVLAPRARPRGEYPSASEAGRARRGPAWRAEDASPRSSRISACPPVIFAPLSTLRLLSSQPFRVLAFAPPPTGGRSPTPTPARPFHPQDA